MRLISIFLFLLFLSSMAVGATYYVSPNGTGDGSAVETPMSWETWTGSSRVSDTAYILEMDSEISGVAWPTATAYYTKLIDQFGRIKWTIQTAGGGYVEVYQFVTLDIGTVGTTVVTAISPATMVGNGSTQTTTVEQGSWTPASGRTVHGSMKNPKPSGVVGGGVQGLDSYWGSAASWSALDADNVGDDLPLTLVAGDSLISTSSKQTPYIDADYRSHVYTAAVLTCLATKPAANSFRPGYCYASGGVTHNLSEIDYSHLLDLTPPSAVPESITVQANRFRQAYLDWVSPVSAAGRYSHPYSAGGTSLAEYGRDYTWQISTAALTLHCNYTDEQKRPLAVGVIQLGLDDYSIVQAGGEGWGEDGGHGYGRKFPILLAGILLNDSGMKSVSANFHEDLVTFYVDPNDEAAGGDVWDVPYRRWYQSGTWYGHANAANATWDSPDYVVHHVGMPEWGIRHTSIPAYDDMTKLANYRQVYGTNLGQMLAMRMVDYNAVDENDVTWGRNIWIAADGHAAAWDYLDRHVDTLFPTDNYQGGFNAWQKAFWDAQRQNYGTEWTQVSYDIVPPNAPTGPLSGTEGDGQVDLSWSAPSVASDGDTASGYRIIRMEDNTLWADANAVTGTDHTLTNLDPLTDYTFAVYAIDDAGIQGTAYISSTFRSTNVGGDQWALDFESSNTQWVSFATSSVWPAQPMPVTILAWVQFESATADRALCGSEYYNQICDLYWDFETTKWVYYRGTGTAGQSTSVSSDTWSPTLSEWYYVSMRHATASSTVEWRINDVSIGTASLTNGARCGTEVMYLGAIRVSGGATTKPWDGQMAGVCLSLSALSDASITTGYRDGFIASDEWTNFSPTWNFTFEEGSGTSTTDAKNGRSGTLGGTTGTPTWTAVVQDDPSPGSITAPSPADGATAVSITTDISWTAAVDSTSNHVYFGTSANAVGIATTATPVIYKGEQVGNTYDVGTLSYSTTYYWRIDEDNGFVTRGTVMSFTTVDQPPKQYLFTR